VLEERSGERQEADQEQDRQPEQDGAATQGAPQGRLARRGSRWRQAWTIIAAGMVSSLRDTMLAYARR
jgi:hypothetical protein